MSRLLHELLPLFLQRKSTYDERMTTTNGEAEGDSSGPEDDKEVNLDNFMTLDSVGDVDGKIESKTFLLATIETRRRLSSLQVHK